MIFNTTLRGQYCDVIMVAMASQITSLTIVYSTVHSGADQRKYQSSASLAFVSPVNSPKKMARNAENVSIWWRHHGIAQSLYGKEDKLNGMQIMSLNNKVDGLCWKNIRNLALSLKLYGQLQ